MALKTNQAIEHNEPILGKKINWSGYEWLTQERWGNIHPTKTLCWYDPTAVEKIYHPNRDDQLVLKTHHNIHYFHNLNVISTIGVGLVSNTTRFKYGYFEIEAKLPRGKHLWPAFWMWSWENWPPEIDIFEGYTRNTKGYLAFNIKNPIGFWDVNTNIHLGKSPNNYNLGAKTHWMGFKDPSKHFIKYGCMWTPYSLDLYYNERIVRTITDPKIMDQFKNTTMNIIINNGVDKDADINNPTESEMVINYFKYKPY